MRRVLFVDDQPDVLEGLQAILAPLRTHWEMKFVRGGEKALAALAAQPFDVLVTDFEMPGMDGPALLRRAQESVPEMVRVVLSGESEQEVARRVAHTAHQFLAKPCERASLYETIERTCALHTLLADPWLKQAIGRVGQLPVLPEIYHGVMRTLEDPNRTLGDVGTVVARDPVLSAKILQLVNSAFFGLPQAMTRIENAVKYLGADVIKCLVLMVDVFRDGALDGIPGANLHDIQHHALHTALIARRLTREKRQQETAFVSGMLHDIGKVVLASRMPDRYARIVTAALETNRPMHAVELDRGGVTHAAIGAYLLAQWGLPYSIVEAVAHHHAPGQVAQRNFDVVGAVYVANLLAHEQEPPPAERALAHDPVDLDYLEKLAVASSLGAWREIAMHEVAQAAPR
jgi:putative nucleotidyltransferase with HDIG domain